MCMACGCVFFVKPSLIDSSDDDGLLALQVSESLHGVEKK